ncbi:hypothetical protein [Brucella pseudogrignonensis]|uniref:hypothetical protein n=1 Tax=Brucella pseudogrignonensis TaxID=419475 RepID=UPI0038D1899C
MRGDLVLRDPVSKIEQSFTSWMRCRLPSLRAFALLLLGDRHVADLLVQETIKSSWEKRDQKENGYVPMVWLLKLFHEELDKFMGFVPDLSASVTNTLKGYETDAISTKAISPDTDANIILNLSLRQREAILLIGAVEISLKDAADICNCSQDRIEYLVFGSFGYLTDSFSKLEL